MRDLARTIFQEDVVNSHRLLTNGDREPSQEEIGSAPVTVTCIARRLNFTLNNAQGIAMGCEVIGTLYNTGRSGNPHSIRR